MYNIRALWQRYKNTACLKMMYFVHLSGMLSAVLLHASMSKMCLVTKGILC